MAWWLSDINKNWQTLPPHYAGLIQQTSGVWHGRFPISTITGKHSHLTTQVTFTPHPLFTKNGANNHDLKSVLHPVVKVLYTLIGFTALFTHHNGLHPVVKVLYTLLGFTALFTHHNYPPRFKEVGENSFGVGFA